MFVVRRGGVIDSVGVGHRAPARLCGGRVVTFEPRGQGAEVLARGIGEETSVPVAEIDLFERVSAIACDASSLVLATSAAHGVRIEVASLP